MTASPGLPPAHETTRGERSRGARAIAAAAGIAHIPEQWLRHLALEIAAGSMRTNPVVGFVASVRREGTTTVVMNLARVLAEELQRRVVLVDACIASPALHRGYGLPQAPGLAEVLCGEVALREAVQLSERGNFAVLPAGRANPAEQGLLLSGPRLPGVFDQLRREAFDVCLVDCPAVLTAPESAIVVRHADVAYCVLRSERTRWDAAEKATDILRASGTYLGGVVLNRTLPHVPRLLRRAMQPHHHGFG